MKLLITKIREIPKEIEKKVKNGKIENVADWV
jgi:hypothetical protein